MVVEEQQFKRDFHPFQKEQTDIVVVSGAQKVKGAQGKERKFLPYPPGTFRRTVAKGTLK